MNQTKVFKENNTFQKLTKRSSAKQYEEDGYKKTKYKGHYSEQRRIKRDWSTES